MSDTSIVPIVAKFHAKGSAEISCACQFSSVEWSLLGRFLEYAKEMGGTTLLSRPGWFYGHLC